jgi:hypothetical protein
VFDHQQAKLTSELAEYEKNKLPAAQAAWEHRLAAESPTVWTPLQAVVASSSSGATLTAGPDGNDVDGLARQHHRLRALPRP